MRLNDIKKKAEDIAVEDIDGFEQAADLGLLIRKEVKDNDAKRKKKVEPLNDEVKEINGKYNKKRDALKAAQALVDSRMVAWYKDQSSDGKAMAKSARGVSGAKPSMRSVILFEVTDPALVPKEYYTIDMDAIKDAVKAGKSIPGIETEETFSVSIR